MINESPDQRRLHTVDIGICTYRRSSLKQTLLSISQQVLPEYVTIRAVIADNEETNARQEDVEKLCHSLSLPFLYVHAPHKNISRARNACLAHATAQWLAFIDDDEVARSDWISCLLSASGGADCVFGVAQAIYDAKAPGWMIKGDFHSHMLSKRPRNANGSTCNVLLNRAFLEQNQISFREELGRIGGEDTMFFHDMAQNGARFEAAPDAIVFEDVPQARANLQWLARRRYRCGQIHYLLLRRERINRAMIALLASAKLTYCYVGAALSFSMVERARRALRGSLHLGVLASAVGIGLYEEYA